MSYAKKRSIRLFTCLFLALTMLLAMTVTASAAGTETWSSSTLTYVGYFHFTNTNLTPVKTIGRTGTLTIWGHFYGEDDNAAYKPIDFMAELRRAYGSTLIITTKHDDRSGLVHFFLQYPVKKGDKLQLFFKIWTPNGELPGYARQAFTEYWYSIT